MTAPRLRRMPGIDGLRAIAVAAVFVYLSLAWQRLRTALAGVPLVVLVNVRVDRGWHSAGHSAVCSASIVAMGTTPSTRRARSTSRVTKASAWS